MIIDFLGKSFNVVPCKLSLWRFVVFTLLNVPTTIFYLFAVNIFVSEEPFPPCPEHWLQLIISQSPRHPRGRIPQLAASPRVTHLINNDIWHYKRVVLILLSWPCQGQLPIRSIIEVTSILVEDDFPTRRFPIGTYCKEPPRASYWPAWPDWILTATSMTVPCMYRTWSTGTARYRAWWGRHRARPLVINVTRSPSNFILWLKQHQNCVVLCYILV